MTFGEVGKTGEQETTSYNSRAAGVGEFEDNKLVERMVQLGSYNWTVRASGVLASLDVDNLLRNYQRVWDVLSQFTYYRPEEIEVTVRLNTNQFYVGSLLAALYPTQATGNWLDELAVLDPTTISASCAEAVVKTYNYALPNAWLQTTTGSPVYLVLYILNNLAAQSANLPDHITVTVWARFKKIRLAYPQLLSLTPPGLRVEAQSASGKLKVKQPKQHKQRFAIDDPGAHSGPNEFGEMFDAVISQPIQQVGGVVSTIADIAGLVGGLAAFLDKPDKTDPQTATIIEPSIDLFSADIPDTNVTTGLYKDRYVDPGPGRLPMSKNFTVSDYAKIPGLKSQYAFQPSVASSTAVKLLGGLSTPTTPRTPVDYALVNSRYWRGSLKVMLQFFASSFTSARFSVQYRNTFDGTYDADYDNGISRVVDVKGDTQELITLPWLSSSWWTPLTPPEIKVSLISEIAGTDPSADPVIYMNVWVAGGDDIQFAWPRVPLSGDWPWRTTSLSPVVQFRADQEKRRKAKLRPEAQSAIGKIFETNFPPIVEDVLYDVDKGLCTAETLESITDICKRYSNPPQNYSWDGSFWLGESLDDLATTPSGGLPYGCFQAFRYSYFGSWRAAFLVRSGGYKCRAYPWVFGGPIWNIADHSVSPACPGTQYTEGFDKVARFTVPQVMPQAFGFLGQPNYQLDAFTQDIGDSDSQFYIAARDDVQLGYPILPNGIPVDYVPPAEGEGGQRNLRQTKGKQL